VVTKELLQKGDSLNQNVQLFSIDFCFGDFTNNPESRVAELDSRPECVARIVNLVQDGSVTLIYSSKNKEYNHAVALLEYLHCIINK
jgi:uncharacterized protein YeaO (DUF488 family)